MFRNRLNECGQILGMDLAGYTVEIIIKAFPHRDFQNASTGQNRISLESLRSYAGEQRARHKDAPFGFIAGHDVYQGDGAPSLWSGDHSVWTGGNVRIVRTCILANVTSRQMTSEVRRIFFRHRSPIRRISPSDSAQW